MGHCNLNCRYWKTTHYDYDPNGSQVDIMVVNNATAATYTYDVRNKMVGYSTGTGSASYVYNDEGNRVAETTGTITTYYLSDTQNPTGVCPAGGGTPGINSQHAIPHISDRGSRLRSGECKRNREVMTVPSGGANAPSGHADEFAYDLANNRTRESINQTASQLGMGDTVSGGLTINYTYNNNDQLRTEAETNSSGTQVYSLTYSYDANGNLKTEIGTGSKATTNTYTYDLRNRMTKAVINGTETDDGYDTAGVLVSETTNAGTNSAATTYYLIDSNNPTGYAKPIEVRVGSVTGTPTTSYILGLDVIGQANSSGAVSYLLIDGQHNTRALVNSSGVVTATFNYSAFGNVLGVTYTPSSPPPTIFLYQQMMYDPASGLNFTESRQTPMGASYWIERDPAGHSDPTNPITENAYLLDNADPGNRIDPSGHESLAELGITETINQTLEAVQFVQKVVRVKNEVSSVLDFIQVIYDIAVSTADGGPLLGIFYGLLNKVPQDLAKVGRSALDPVNLFESIGRNATRIAATNVESPSKDFTIASAFTAPDSAVVLYVPGFLGNIAPKPTGLKVAGRPLDIASHQGFSFGGIGIFSAETGEVQFFHVDLVIPGFGEDLAGHTGPTKDDIDTWIDGDLNYQVPR